MARSPLYGIFYASSKIERSTKGHCNETVDIINQLLHVFRSWLARLPHQRRMKSIMASQVVLSENETLDCAQN